jgi:hypothetical protein
MTEKISLDWKDVMESLPDQPVKLTVDRQRCTGRDCPHSGHAFIPDPGKWVGVMLDGFARFDVAGWRYCPALDDSHPIVSTQKQGGRMGILHTENGFIVVIPRWAGVKFGGVDVDRDAQAETYAHLVRTFGQKRLSDMTTAALHFDD